MPSTAFINTIALYPIGPGSPLLHSNTSFDFFRPPGSFPCYDLLSYGLELSRRKE